MRNDRFWVLGGEFANAGFDRLVTGTERLIGPFPDRSEAESTWRNLSEEYRSSCTMRFTVVQEPVRQADRFTG